MVGATRWDLCRGVPMVRRDPCSLGAPYDDWRLPQSHRSVSSRDYRRGIRSDGRRTRGPKDDPHLPQKRFVTCMGASHARQRTTPGLGSGAFVLERKRPTRMAKTTMPTRPAIVLRVPARDATEAPASNWEGNSSKLAPVVDKLFVNGREVPL